MFENEFAQIEALGEKIKIRAECALNSPLNEGTLNFWLEGIEEYVRNLQEQITELKRQN